jgi:hypothetical protein
MGYSLQLRNVHATLQSRQSVTDFTFFCFYGECDVKKTDRVSESFASCAARATPYISSFCSATLMNSHG